MGQRQLKQPSHLAARRAQRMRSSRNARRGRRGLSLVEVVVALAILGSVMLGLGMFSAKMSQSTSGSRLKILASQLANERLDLVKTAPRYSMIESVYVATESNVRDPAYGVSGGASPAIFTRQTWVKRVGGAVTDTTDYKLVTVQVTSPSMPDRVRKTTAISFY
jgi:prepilin-type N-terminal cleavage/methylation domain-containing protein